MVSDFTFQTTLFQLPLVEFWQISREYPQLSEPFLWKYLNTLHEITSMRQWEKQALSYTVRVQNSKTRMKEKLAISDYTCIFQYLYPDCYLKPGFQDVTIRRN